MSGLEQEKVNRDGVFTPPVKLPTGKATQCHETETGSETV